MGITRLTSNATAMEIIYPTNQKPVNCFPHTHNMISTNRLRAHGPRKMSKCILVRVNQQFGAENCMSCVTRVEHWILLLLLFIAQAVACSNSQSPNKRCTHDSKCQTKMETRQIELKGVRWVREKREHPVDTKNRRKSCCVCAWCARVSANNRCYGLCTMTVICFISVDSCVTSLFYFILFFGFVRLRSLKIRQNSINFVFYPRLFPYIDVWFFNVNVWWISNFRAFSQYTAKHAVQQIDSSLASSANVCIPSGIKRHDDIPSFFPNIL